MSDATPRGAFNEAASPELRELLRSIREVGAANGSQAAGYLNRFMTKQDIEASKIDGLQEFVDDRIKKLVIDPLNKIREALNSSNVKYGIKMIDHLVDSLQEVKKKEDEGKA